MNNIIDKATSRTVYVDGVLSFSSYRIKSYEISMDYMQWFSNSWTASNENA